jgi:hypothetical protein
MAPPTPGGAETSSSRGGDTYGSLSRLRMPLRPTPLSLLRLRRLTTTLAVLRPFVVPLVVPWNDITDERSGPLAHFRVVAEEQVAAAVDRDEPRSWYTRRR